MHVDVTVNERCKCVHTNDKEGELNESQLVYKCTEDGRKTTTCLTAKNKNK